MAISKPPAGYEEQFILRTTPELAKKLHASLRGEEGHIVGLQVDNERSTQDKPVFTLTVDGEVYDMDTMNLPTVLEAQVTGDGRDYIKMSNISQALVVRPDEEDDAVDSSQALSRSHQSGANDASGSSQPAESSRLPPAPREVNSGDGRRVMDSGLTPPAAHIVPRRFKSAHKTVVGDASREEIAGTEAILRHMTHEKEVFVAEEDFVDSEPFMDFLPDEFEIEFVEGHPTRMTALSELSLRRIVEKVNPSLTATLFPPMPNAASMASSGQLSITQAMQMAQGGTPSSVPQAGVSYVPQRVVMPPGTASAGVVVSRAPPSSGSTAPAAPGTAPSTATAVPAAPVSTAVPAHVTVSAAPAAQVTAQVPTPSSSAPTAMPTASAVAPASAAPASAAPASAAPASAAPASAAPASAAPVADPEERKRREARVNTLKSEVDVAQQRMEQSANPILRKKMQTKLNILTKQLEEAKQALAELQ